MKLSPTTSFLALGTIASATLHLEKRDSPAVVSFPFEKKLVSTPLPASQRIKRAGEDPVVDLNYQHQILYIIELDIGTPPQTVYAQLDTGSPTLILETTTNNLCSEAAPNPCTMFGGYNANASSTYEYIASDLSIVYGGGDGATGDHAFDNTKVGSATITDLFLGLMYQTTVVESVCGVLYTEDERDGNAYDPPRKNIPLLLRDQGFIATRAFSLWTNDIHADAGQVLFGGVDTKRFYGNLVTIPLLANPDTEPPRVTDFLIPLLSVTGSAAGVVTTTLSNGAAPYNVNLDSGTTLIMLEPGLVQNIWDFMGATAFSGSPNFAFAPCSTADINKSVDFSFAGVTIRVPFNQLIFPPGDDSGFCQLGIEKATDGGYLLGDFFLSSAYVVYDLDNYEVHLAQAVYNPTGSNVLQITAGPNGVPNGPGVGASTSSSSTKTSTTSSTSKPSTTSTKPPTTTSTKPTTLTTSTVSPTKLVCNTNNCLDAVIHGSAAAFCSSIRAGIPVATPTNIAAKCSSLPSKVSSACACYTSVVATTSTKPPTTTAPPTTTPTKPAVCNMNNCLRAIEHTPGFCATYLATSTAAAPINIAASCSNLPSKISSGCLCAATAA